ncbi:MAG TPA: DUF6544 family protein, partial [Longimicrobiales bacterium]|nr:DUF6544 family protein [Longimicrobiales bacterium]
VRVVADRYRDVNGVPVLTPFEGTFGAYGEVDGMLIPLEGEVGWMLPDGRFPYWRGRVAKVEYGYGDDGSVGEIPSAGSADAPQTET